jgi:hypothetical protein
MWIPLGWFLFLLFEDWVEDSQQHGLVLWHAIGYILSSIGNSEAVPLSL